MRSVCVFCGSSAGDRPEYLDLARTMGALLAQRGLTLVYGGGRVGLMGALADATLEAGGSAVGVIPQMLLDKEVGHTGLTQLHVVASMTERKLLMGELSDAFIALPGGIGTMDELFEVWTWTQLELHCKPCGLVNHGGYYDALVSFLEHAVREGFLRPRHRAALMIEPTAQALLDRIQAQAA